MAGIEQKLGKVEKALLESALGDGVKAGTNQVRPNIKRLGEGWQETLFQTLDMMGSAR